MVVTEERNEKLLETPRLDAKPAESRAFSELQAQRHPQLNQTLTSGTGLKPPQGLLLLLECDPGLESLNHSWC